jgi:hypothetical protein
MPQALKHAIRATRGNLQHDSFLSQLTIEFGQSFDGTVMVDRAGRGSFCHRQAIGLRPGLAVRACALDALEARPLVFDVGLREALFVAPGFINFEDYELDLWFIEYLQYKP